MHQIEYFQCIKRGWSGSFRYERSSSHGGPQPKARVGITPELFFWHLRRFGRWIAAVPSFNVGQCSAPMT